MAIKKAGVFSSNGKFLGVDFTDYHNEKIQLARKPAVIAQGIVPEHEVAIISPEWTAQIIEASKILASYYQGRDSLKRDFYNKIAEGPYKKSRCQCFLWGNWNVASVCYVS